MIWGGFGVMEVSPRQSERGLIFWWAEGLARASRGVEWAGWGSGPGG